MRDAVLNSAGLSVQFPNQDEALDALDNVASGLIALSVGKHIAPHLWSRNQPFQISVCQGMNLIELFREYLGRDKDRATFLLRMVTRCPIDDGVEAANLEDFVENEIEGLPGCIDLLWCAVSDTKIAVSLTPENRWLKNPLTLKLGRNGTYPKSVDVENVFSFDSAQDTLVRLNALRLTGIVPADLWKHRSDLFPNLIFGTDVEKQLQTLGADHFVSAVERMVEIDKAATEWDATTNPSPTYLSKVTGESAATMQKYGHERIYRSSTGQIKTFEKHARLHNGGRIHLREIPLQSKIEIGYIGKHLRIVSTD